MIASQKERPPRGSGIRTGLSTHDPDHIEQLKDSIEAFGFVQPILIDAEKRTLRISLNRLAEKSGWNQELLALEFKELLELDLSLDLTFDLTITGFGFAEIDQLIETRSAETESDADDLLPDASSGPPVSQRGDLWLLADHRLICGDARDKEVYGRLLGDERAALGIHDAPYDVRMRGSAGSAGSAGTAATSGPIPARRACARSWDSTQRPKTSA